MAAKTIKLIISSKIQIPKKIKNTGQSKNMILDKL